MTSQVPVKHTFTQQDVIDMNQILRRSSVLLAILVLAGCRSYGGYGSEAETYRQIERIINRFEEDLSRARADLRQIEAASSGSEYLSALAAQHARLVAGHEAVLQEQRENVVALSPESEYRTLHAVYNSMVAEQRLVRKQYQAVLRHVYEGFSPDSAAPSRRDIPYYVVPPHYARIGFSGRNLTVNEVIALVRSGATPQEGFEVPMPPAEEAAAEQAAESEAGH